MKKLLTLLMLAFLTLTSIETQAQAFDKSTILMTLAIGPGEMIHFPTGDNNPFSSSNLYGTGLNGTRTVITGQLSFQAEFAVHKYVGVGFLVGIGGRAESVGSLNGFAISLGYPKEVNIPIGVLANFHFFQLIADNKGLDLGNKLDVYAGITAGSGVAIHPYGQNDQNYANQTFYDALFYFGPHAGVNYYFANNIAVHGEIGWGATIVQAGFTFKLGGGGTGGKKK